MKKPTPTFSWEEFDVLRSGAGLAQREEAPAHAKTVREWAARYHVSETAARRELKQLCAVGRLQRGIKYVVDSADRRFPVPAYWPCANGKKSR